MDTENSTESYWFCPLLAFNCAPEIIDLDYRPENVELAKNIQVKLMLQKFMDYLHKNYPDSPDIISAEYMIVLSLPSIRGDTIMKSIWELTSKASDLLFDLITAFRLCHGGVVTPGPLLRGSMKGSRFYVYERGHVPSLFMEFLPSISKKEVDYASFELPEYEFSSSDVPVVNKLLSEILKHRKSGQFAALNETLSRFNSAYYGEFESRLVDQMIAFESLYLGSEQELTYKLASRAAFLLHRRKDYRMLVFNNIKKAYNYRSRIVHGDNPPSRDELRAIVPKTQDYLRQSIRKFLLLLSRGHSLKELREKLLDENILKNGALLA